LTVFAWLDAILVAKRMRPAGRAELAVVASAVVCALISAPVLVLGYTDQLTRPKLAITAACLFAGTFAAIARTRPREAVREAWAAWCSLVRMPRDALRAAWRERSVTVIGLGMAVVLFAASFVLTVFVPNATWDGFLYHEAIVGFALQNHGFAPVSLSHDVANQATNGYPKLGEALQIWLVAFTDKTVIELPNNLGAFALMIASYDLARRFTRHVDALGWACVVLFVPQLWAQLCQTYVDVLVAFFAVTLIHFATRPNLRVRDVWMMTLASALWTLSKGSAPAIAPFVACVGWIRLMLQHRRTRRAVALGTVFASGSLVLAAATFVPIRSWLVFGNPFWPVTIDVLGHHFDGCDTLRGIATTKPFIESITMAYEAPIGGVPDAQQRGYGYALAWVVGPVALVGVFMGASAALKELFRLRERTEASNVGLVILVMIMCSLAAPNLGGNEARYNLHVVACVVAIAAWVLARPGWRAVRRVAIPVSMALTLIPLTWMRGVGWYWVSTKHYEDVFSHPLAARVVLPRPEFDIIAEARERELHAGDLVVFDQNVTFIGALWNFDMSNRIEYVPYAQPRDFVREVEQRRPTWVAVGESDEARKTLEATNRWEYVGALTPNIGAVYRRKSLVQSAVRR
jgi:hypothetical protein